MRTSIILLAFATSCGFAPQPSFTGGAPGSGIAAWQDQGALQLCLADERVGTPAAGAGGLCTDINAPDEPLCADDAACGSRELCICGRCTVSYCDSNAECPPGHACNFTEKRCAPTCLSDSDCHGHAEFCSGGFCKGRCGMDDDCQTGEFCSSMGRCTVRACANDSSCQGTDFCRQQRTPRATAQPAALAGPAAHGASASRGRFVLWFEMSNEAGTQRAIYRATSDDGLHYQVDPADPVLTDGGDAHAPSVVATSAGLELYYETAAGIRHATSADGVSFAAPTTIIAGDWHAPAAAVTPDGQTLVYVERGARQAIGLWQGSGTPADVFTPGDATLPELWRDVNAVGSPFALVDASGPEPTVRLWFDAFGAESGDSMQFGMVVPLPPNDSIGYAAAPLSDPTAFVAWPYNPVFDRVQAFLDHEAELAPAVVEDPDQPVWFLYYGGTTRDGMTDQGIGVARNPPLVAP
jgi:hypothetical protein